MRFGDCLHLLTAKYGRTRSEVVAALAQQGIDRTLVYRWFRNERVPGLKSGHCQRIARSLHLSREDYELLLRAQIESLAGKADLQPSPDQLTGELLDAETPGGAPPPPSDGSGVAPVKPAHSMGCTSLLGQAVMLETTIAILGSLSQPTPAAREILFSSQSGITSDLGEVDRARWVAALRTVMDKGFDFVHLLRIDSDAHGAEQAVEYVLALEGAAGRYSPFYFTRYGIEPSRYDLLVIAGTAALLSFATTRRDRLDAALLLNDQAQIELLRAHFSVLQSQARPLFTSSWDVGRHLEEMSAAIGLEERSGELLFLGWGLSIRTQPYGWWARWDGQGGHPNGMDEAVLELGKRRLDSFYRQVEEHRVVEICPRSSVLRMVRTGEGPPQSPHASRTPRDRIEHLENLIALLNSFDNYELVLPGDAEEKELSPGLEWTIKWDVGGDPVVHLESLTVNGRRPASRLGVEIREPMVASAFRRRFLELFNHRISPLSKDKGEVCAFLESQVEWLRRRMDR